MSTADLLSVILALRLPSGERFGDVAEPWQLEDLEAIADPAPPHLHFLTRPRGASKTEDLARIAAVSLLAEAPPASRSYAVAADADQAGLLLDALRGLVIFNPSLSQHLRIESRRVVCTEKHATLAVLPADEASAYGLKPWLVIADELSAWPSTPNARGVWTAVVSAMPKIADARLVVLTTAGDPAHWSAKVLELAKTSPAWRVNEVPGPCPWVAPDALDEQRRLLTESQYARLHLNIWTAAEDRLVRPEDLAACVRLDGPQAPREGVRYVVGVDVGLRHDRTAIAVCHAEPDGRVVLDRLIVLAGSRTREVSLQAVEDNIFEVHELYDAPNVRLDPWQAIGLRQRLQARGVRVEEYAFSQQSVARLASTLHLLLRDRLLDLPDDEALLDELAAVRLRESSPGVLRLDHDAGQHDDRAVALALAAQALVARPSAMRSAPPADLFHRRMFREAPGSADIPAPGASPTPASIGRAGRGPIDWTRRSGWWSR